jgi:hypothetical protein
LEKDSPPQGEAPLKKQPKAAKTSRKNNKPKNAPKNLLAERITAIVCSMKSTRMHRHTTGEVAYTSRKGSKIGTAKSTLYFIPWLLKISHDPPDHVCQQKICSSQTIQCGEVVSVCQLFQNIPGEGSR